MLERFPEKWQELLYSLKNQNISLFYVFSSPEEGGMAVCVRGDGVGVEEKVLGSTAPDLSCSRPTLHLEQKKES